MYLIRRVFVMGSNKHNSKTTNKTNHEKSPVASNRKGHHLRQSIAKTTIITVSIGTPYLLTISVLKFEIVQSTTS